MAARSRFLKSWSRRRDEPSGAAIEATRAAVTAPLSGRPIAAAMAAAADAAAASMPDAEPEPEPLPAVRKMEPAWPEIDFRAVTQRDGLSLVPAGSDAISAADPEPDNKERDGETSKRRVPAVNDWPAADLAAKVSKRAQPAVETQVAAATSAEDAAVPSSIAPILAAVGVMDAPFDATTPLGPVGESEHQPTGDELLAAAEAADVAGDATTLHSLLLWTARAYAREGRFDAGLDATHRLLQKAPGDVDAHLVLVELYVARDWNALAAEKLALLGRLAELNNDEATRQRLCGVATRAFPNDTRLGALCA
jgi:hypothetical protein